MAERNDDEVMAQREATVLAIEQFAAEIDAIMKKAQAKKQNSCCEDGL